MAKALILVLAAGIAIGLVVGFAAGRLHGTGAFAAAVALGAILVVLRRNQQDLRELEQGLVPPGVDHAGRRATARAVARAQPRGADGRRCRSGSLPA